MVSLFQHHLTELLSQLNNLSIKPRLIVALSGGVDSVALLHLLAVLRDKHSEFTVLAHNVNHGLSENAQYWTEFCETLCKQLKVTLISSTVNIENKPRKSLEALARDARYQCFKDRMQSGDVILTGHHQDDQLETLLLALKRGSGSTGLQGIHSTQVFFNGFLVRPLLNFSRQQIVDYALFHGLQWIEDESNLDIEFDRNFIRQKISPLLIKRWPAIAQSVSRTAQLCQEQQSLLNEVAEVDLNECAGFHYSQHTLLIAKLTELSVARRNNVIRYWLKLNGLNYPSNKQLQVLWKEVALASLDKQPKLILESHSIRRYQEALYIVNEEQIKLVEEPKQWRGEPLLEFVQTKVRVDFSQVDPMIAKQYKVACYFRHHLEANLTCLPEGRNKQRSIKKLLHEYQVPPWLRDQIIFIMIDNHLVEAIGLWQCQHDNLPVLTVSLISS